MTTYYAVLTEIGRSKLAAAAASSSMLNITQMALGDGNGNPVPAPAGTETALVHQVWIGALNSLTVQGAQFTAEAVVPHEVGGWTVHELGLVDGDGDLVAYANTPPIAKTTSDDVPMDFRPTVTVNVDAPGSVQVIVNPAIVSASRQWVDDGYLAKGRNLSDLTDAAAARTNLGAGAADGLATLDATAKVPMTQLHVGEANGLAELDNTGKVPVAQLPSLAIADTFTASSEAAMLALAADKGDMCVRTDLGATYVLSADPASTLGNWVELMVPASVTSVAGKTGTVTLVKADVGLGNVDNTADSAKPVSTAQAAADANTLASAKLYTDQMKAALTKSDVGLVNVDNTSDADKPVSSAQASADADTLVSAQQYADAGDAALGVTLTAHKGDSGAHGATPFAVPFSIMRRDATGRVKAALPFTDDDVATKGYVNQKLRKLGLGLTGETWQIVSPRRLPGVLYTNTLNYPVQVLIRYIAINSAAAFILDNVVMGLQEAVSIKTLTFIWPPGSSWKITNVGNSGAGALQVLELF